MRLPIIAAFALASSRAALAQEVVVPPAIPAPIASAPIDERATWCDQYATWLVAMTPSPGAATESQEAQHLQVEFNACKIDPQQYERETRTRAYSEVDLGKGSNG